MNSSNRRLIIGLILLSGFTACVNKPHIDQSIVVKIAPLSEKGLSLQEAYWQRQKLLFPKTIVPSPIPHDFLPNDDSLLVVSLEKRGEISLNGENVSESVDTSALLSKLSIVFRERGEAAVYEPGSDRVVKAVAVKAPLSAKYGEVFAILEAVKTAGADPIVLQIDDLPE